MKKLLTLILLSMHAYSYGSDLEESMIHHRDVLLRIFELHDAKNPIDLPIKEYVGKSLFGNRWKQFIYPIYRRSTITPDEAIGRNIIVAQLEQKALAEGRFDVYGFMIKHTDKTRFE
jgi:hypothetical protein